MKRNIYGWCVSAVAVLLALVFVFQNMLHFRETNDIYIEGDYVGYTSPQTRISVTDGESALAAASDIFQIDKKNLSLTLEDTNILDDETFYKMQQMYDSIPVWGRAINLSVDDDKIYLASGNVGNEEKYQSMTLYPEITWYDAEAGVRDYIYEQMSENGWKDEFDFSLGDFDDEDLCIYDQGVCEGVPRLAYSSSFTYSGTDSAGSPVSGSYDVLFDAHTAEVLYATPNVYASTESMTYMLDANEYDVELEKSGDLYFFRDTARNLVLHDAENKDYISIINSRYSAGELDDFSYDDNYNYSVVLGEEYEVYIMPVKSNAWENTDDGKALKVFSGAQTTYDFYRSILGRQGFNNGNGQMLLAINHANLGYSAFSSWVGNATLLAFEKSCNLDEIDLVAHEFTHSVESSISYLVYKGEAGAIQEGYCDTFGELVEAYNKGAEPDWIHGERNLKAELLEYNGDHPADSTEYEEPGWKYDYSFYVSHRAYQIWQAWTAQGIELDEKIKDMAHLLYRVLYLLEHYTSFEQWYWAMESVAQSMLDRNELTQAQYDAVIDNLGTGREESEDLAESFEQLKTVAVLMAEEYERSGEEMLTNEVRELASISLIPEITRELKDQTGLPSNYQCRFIYEEIVIPEKGMDYYYCALWGHNYLTGNYYTHYNENNGYGSYVAEYQSMEDVCRGWDWHIDNYSLQDSEAIWIQGTLTSPDGKAEYRMAFELELDKGGKTGAFMNVHYIERVTLIDKLNEITDIASPEDMEQAESVGDTVLLDWLDSLVIQCGVIDTGTEEYYSEFGSFEHVIPNSRIFGLLAADMDDYDGDGENELLTITVLPDSYETGRAQEWSQTYIQFDLYGVRSLEVVLEGNMGFSIYGLPETEYQNAFHVFKATDGEKIHLYFDYYFAFNSQNFGVIELECDDGLHVKNGAELSEYAYGIVCEQAVSNQACDSICDTLTDVDGWSVRASNDWEEYFDDEDMNNAVDDALRVYDSILSDMGLTDTKTRARYADDDTSSSSLQSTYSRCCLRPLDHYEYDYGEVESICSLLTPYGQGSVTLTVEDDTTLLYPYRTGEKDKATTDAILDIESTEEDAADEDSETNVIDENTISALDPSLIYYADIEIQDYGTITVQLDQASAPITVANFVTLAESGFYDGLTFHRIIEGFMMQGGDPEGNGTGGSDENIVGEFTANGYDNTLSHTRGAISMARSSDYDSANSQFFIVHEDSSASLDGQYAVFGYVTEGMDVVDAVCETAKPTDNYGTIDADTQPVITSVTIRTEPVSSKTSSDSTNTLNTVDKGTGGYDSYSDVFYAFTDILIHGSAEDMIDLYSDQQLSSVEARGFEIAAYKAWLIDEWQTSWESVKDTNTWMYELKEVTELNKDDIDEKYGKNDATPDAAVKMKIVGKSVPDKTFSIFAVCYDGRWYLST